MNLGSLLQGMGPSLLDAVGPVSYTHLDVYKRQDMACVDAVNRQPVLPGSFLADQECHCHDHFINAHPDTNWETCIDHAVKLGLGNKEYHLITI